jgi:hypothetical protein
MEFQVGGDGIMVFNDKNSLTIVGFHGSGPLLGVQWIHGSHFTTLLCEERLNAVVAAVFNLLKSSKLKTCRHDCG